MVNGRGWHKMSLEIIDAKKVPLNDEDIRMIAEIETHPEVRKWDMDVFSHSNDLETNIRGFKKFFEGLPKNDDQLCLAAKKDGKAVGWIGIHRFSAHGPLKKHVGDVGIAVHPNYWNQGIGTELMKAGVELARKAGFKRLEAGTLATNRAMRRIAEKAGYQLEGIQRRMFKKWVVNDRNEVKVIDDEYLDTVQMAILL